MRREGTTATEQSEPEPHWSWRVETARSSSTSAPQIVAIPASSESLAEQSRSVEREQHRPQEQGAQTRDEQLARRLQRV